MNIAMNAIPDGIYTARIETLTMKKTKRTGDPMLEWSCTVDSGKHDGVTFVKRSVLSTPKSKQFTAGEFQKLGKRVGNSTDLRNCRSEIEGLYVKVAVVTDENGGVAYYILGLADPTPEHAPDDNDDAWNMEW